MTRIHCGPLRETMYHGALPNGMPLFVLPKPDFSKSYAMVVIRYGSMDARFVRDGRLVETPAGVAHFLEHKMFDMPEYNALQRFAENGASPNAYTSYNRTAYHFSATENFYENLDTLLSLVTTPCFSSESVQKEQGIIGQEIQMIADSPGARVFENLFSGLYEHHPVKTPIAGTVESIDHISAETLHQCFSSFYHPARMLLAVSGPLHPEEVLDCASALLPPAQDSPDMAAEEITEDPDRAYRPLTETSMEVSKPLFALGFKCAPPRGGKETAVFTLLADLAMDALCGKGSGLYASLYNEGLINDSFDQGEFHVENAHLLLAVGESRDPEHVRERLLAEAAHVGREGFDEEVFQGVKRAHLGARICRFDAPESLCHMAAEAHDHAVSPFDFYDILEHFTSRQAAALIAENLTVPKSSLSVVSPRRQ